MGRSEKTAGARLPKGHEERVLKTGTAIGNWQSPIGNLHMLCEETRQSLSLYVDDCVSLPARVAIDAHLDRCPVCRAEVAELRSLTRGLGLLSRPTPPADLAVSISNALYIE